MIKIRKLLHFCRLFAKTNVIKTIYLNFKILPYKQAVKMPIYFYGKIFTLDLSGKIIIEGDIHPGMIRFGYKWFDLWPTSFLPTQLQVKGTLIFKGRAVVSGGANVNVQSEDGVLIVGERTLIGGGTVVKCLKRIEIGEETGITGNCTIMDCNMHFVKNITTGAVANYKAPIKIGKLCWINAGSIISKGAVIPDYSISARNSYLSKDYSEYGTNLFLVGSPAKPATSKVQRIFTAEKQEEYREYFNTHDTDILQLEPGIEIETGTREGF